MFLLKLNQFSLLKEIINSSNHSFKTYIFCLSYFSTNCMQSQEDEEKFNIQQQEIDGIFSFPYQVDSPKLDPYLLNHYGSEALENPQSVKYLHEIYPLNQTVETRRQQMKRFFGLKFLFGLQGVEEKSQNDFLQDIDAQIFNSDFFDDPNLVDLNKFFEDDEPNSQSNQHKKLLDELTKKLSEIQTKAFAGISIHKTIGNAFFEHYSNFLMLKSQQNFFQSFEFSFDKLINQSRGIKKSGPHLILMIYEFWMRMFREFVKEIWRHSQKYSQMFKKNKINQKSYQERSNKSSTSSSQQGEKIQRQKRKPWSKSEIEILQKIINSNAVFNGLRLQQLAQEFGRSSTSISSKIQKIIKQKKQSAQEQFEDDIPIDKKIDVLLKLHPQGLSKEEVVRKINEMYDMGLEDNWKKSVCQILSSKKNVSKIKGTYRLSNPSQFINHQQNQTLKDKLIGCLLCCNNFQGDQKNICQKYLQVYGKQENIDENDRQKVKIIETNISKCLNRYDIFQKTNEKIIYKLNDHQEDCYMDVEDYID